MLLGKQDVARLHLSPLRRAVVFARAAGKAKERIHFRTLNQELLVAFSLENPILTCRAKKNTHNRVLRMSDKNCHFTYCLAAIVLVLVFLLSVRPDSRPDTKFSHVNPAALLLAGFFLSSPRNTIDFLPTLFHPSTYVLSPQKKV